MEAVGAAASILGILGAAIKSAEVIRELLASVKYGLSHVKELTLKADGLRGLLVQVNGIATQCNPSSFSELQNLVQRCKTDLLDA
jgi:hypothetical protein